MGAYWWALGRDRSGNTAMTNSLTELASGNRPRSSETFNKAGQGGDAPLRAAEAVLCDFRRGCALVVDLFPDRAAFAQITIQSNPHLAEALFELGWSTDGKSVVDMALAMQEARTCPPSGCSCVPSK